MEGLQGWAVLFFIVFVFWFCAASGGKRGEI